VARGSKKKYTSKQKRKAHDIEKGYKNRGASVTVHVSNLPVK
jgi:hypothetical protein